MSARNGAKVELPGMKAAVTSPSRSSVAWYLGLGAMTALEIIEWPIALIVAASHVLATHSHNPEVKQLGAGAEAGS